MEEDDDNWMSIVEEKEGNEASLILVRAIETIIFPELLERLLRAFPLFYNFLQALFLRIFGIGSSHKKRRGGGLD